MQTCSFDVLTDFFVRMQLEETTEVHMIHAYVNLQEGSLMDGETKINLAIAQALEKYAALKTLPLVLAETLSEKV